MKTKLTYLTVVLGMVLGFSSCDLNYYPSDEQSSDVIIKESSATIMDGCYALLKDEVEYLGWPSGNTYCRHWFQMAEFPADNICLSGKSTDPLFQATTYTMTDNLQNVGTLWMLGYKIIYMTNTIIEAVNPDKAEDRQILGEAYFMRALMHLNMVTLFAKPYAFGRDNPGVPLDTVSIVKDIKRNPVGEVYDQVVTDLLRASELMEKSRGNAGYPSRDAALGLLSRVYLYMENYDECINTVNKMLEGKDAASMLDANLASYFANAKTSIETLFCIAHEVTEDRGQSSIGSMYNGDGGGWGEIYPSFPLLNLYERYPTDIRYTAFIKAQYPEEGPSDKLKVFIPRGDAGSEEKRDIQTFDAKVDTETGAYYFSEKGTRYDIEDRIIQGEYHEYHVNYKEEDRTVRIIPGNILKRSPGNYPKYFVTKYGYQDGSPTLSSPVVLRWAEVILNRAEAYARTNKSDEALKDVNIIRTRAGIPSDGLFASDKMHGYASAIDVVMDERRLELAFEGHRMFDVYRNKQSMNRQYPGLQLWKIVPYDEPHIQYPIPYAEWTVSGIEQNQGY
ncbi:MAG: RagB/SusD family nutrient uptake outer membrane protein [Paludibacteraceae bacterium]|nr:RagB/SusD family nutrient uptake outer membrane protein [Paludibacteraceae bacterium]